MTTAWIVALVAGWAVAIAATHRAAARRRRQQSAINPPHGEQTCVHADCAQLIAFTDGELSPEQAAAFRAHLATCDACQRGLVEAEELSARLSALEEGPER